MLGIGGANAKPVDPNLNFDDRWKGDGAGDLKKNESYVPMKFDPGTSRTKVTPISLSLNVDGRTLAQSISEQLEQLYEHATGAPSYNGQSHFGRADGGIMGT